MAFLMSMIIFLVLMMVLITVDLSKGAHGIGADDGVGVDDGDCSDLSEGSDGVE